MGFYVNPPSDAFQAVLKTKTYVDKSELIAYTNELMESSRMLTCSSRPDVLANPLQQKCCLSSTFQCMRQHFIYNFTSFSITHV